MKKKLMMISLTAASIVMFAGCSSSRETGGKEGPNLEKHDPVTVRIGVKYLTEEEFNAYIVEPVKKKYPWITVEDVKYGKGNELEDLVASGQAPDLVIHHNLGGMQSYLDLGLAYPLTEMIKKYDMDIGRFEPETIEAVKASTSRDDLLALPYTRHFSALYYNKDIFDKFGVHYPKDGMSWDDAYELAKKLTRMEGGVQYRGLEQPRPERPISQLSLPYVDPKTNKAVINTDAWKKALDFLLKIYQIPGNEQISDIGDADKQFVTGTLAMLATNNIFVEAEFDKHPDLNWDMASYPTWPEAPGKGMRVDQHMMSITNTSKNKDAAFLVISTITSNEVQMEISKNARFSILKDKQIKDAFGANMGFLNGKNLQAVHKTSPAAFPATVYDNYAKGPMTDALNEAVKTGKDLNTALREAEEKANQKIAEAIAKTK